MKHLKCLVFEVLREGRKINHKFDKAKVCKAAQVRKYSVNPKLENEVFG